MIVLLRKSIEAIMDSENGEISLAKMRNFREANVTIHECNRMIQQYLDEKWLIPGGVDEQTITLGPRSFLELMTFLRELGLMRCSICSCEVLQGIECKTSDCPTRVHHLCFDLLQKSSQEYACPACRATLEKP